MNLGMQRPLTMTVKCASCSEQFGAWRPRCPACGTATPAPPKAFNAPKIKKRKEPHPTECTLCRCRGAKAKCPHCDEKIHATCLRLHVDDCKRFQEELRVTEQRLA